MKKNISINQFRTEFPNDDVCLEYMFNLKYGKKFECPNCHKQDKFYRIKKRKVYSCKWCGYQVSPTAGTIFHKSSTSLFNWFYAIYLFSQAKNGVSAKELERHLNITYKTAWRMAYKIRSLMEHNGDMLAGVVEVDETYFGGVVKSKKLHLTNKSMVMGMVERKGRVVAKKIDAPQNHILLNNIKENIKKGSYLMTDEFPPYKKIPHFGYQRGAVKHSRKEYAKGNIHTNTIEGFWGQLKRSISGTYHVVSPKYLQNYVDEFSFRYNHRGGIVFYELLGRLIK